MVITTNSGFRIAAPEIAARGKSTTPASIRPETKPANAFPRTIANSILFQSTDAGVPNKSCIEKMFEIINSHP